MDEVLNQQEMLWFQKSRMDVIRDGDRSTKYFHLSTVIRRRRNKIKALQNNAGDWIFCQDEIKAMLHDNWSSLFQEEPCENFTGEWLLHDYFPLINSGNLFLAHLHNVKLRKLCLA